MRGPHKRGRKRRGGEKVMYMHRCSSFWNRDDLWLMLMRLHRRPRRRWGNRIVHNNEQTDGSKCDIFII